MHGRSGVAVDATDAGDAMTESVGLDDFGDVVFDEPGLVRVAQVVEVLPAMIGGQPSLGLPLTAGVQVRRLKLERRR